MFDPAHAFAPNVRKPPLKDILMITLSLLGKIAAQTRAKAVVGAAVMTLGLIAAPAIKADPIQGAGSTFAAPAVAKWSKLYQDARADGGDYISPDWVVDYELVGSRAGLMRLAQPETDFAATDIPLPPEELAKHGQQQFPILMGGVAVVVNLDGIGKDNLRLTGAVLADIYQGKITSWSDAAIKALNPEIALPDLAIRVFHRKDSSGTTFVFTEYLSAVSEEWNAKIGKGFLVPWPVGANAEGTQDLLNKVRMTKGGIAYGEFGQVRRAGLSFAAIQNQAGQFVKPEPAGVQAAVAAADWAKTKDFSVSLVNQQGASSYPISTATFVVVPVAGRSVARISRVHDLFRLAFDKGAEDAAALGYVPVPPFLVEQVKQYWLKGGRAGG